MPRAALSNRQRRELRKQAPTAPRLPKADASAKVVKVAPAEKAAEPANRDGLVWLAKKKRLTIPQIGAGFYYRDLFRTASPGSVKSCVEGLGGVGGGHVASLPFGGQYTDSAAQLELFVIRSLTFADQPDLVTAMDGVCGVGHTLRYLAGGDRHRADQLEVALRIALDLLTSVRAAKLKAAKRAA